MARYVTVTAAAARSVIATVSARSVAVSRRYLFSLAARASVVAHRSVGAAMSRGRAALVPFNAARTVAANVVARRALAAQALGQRIVSAGLGAKRVLLAGIAGSRVALSFMVRRRPGAGAVAGSRAASALPWRGRVASASVFGGRSVGVTPITSRDERDGGVLVDNLGANIVDSSGNTFSTLVVTITTSYLRWRVFAPVIAGARSVTSAMRVQRGLSSAYRGVREVSASSRRICQLAVAFVADPTVQRFLAMLQREEGEAAPIVGRRVVTANVYGIKPLTAALAPRTTISASLFNSTLMTDSSGAPITDASSIQFNVYA